MPVVGHHRGTAGVDKGILGVVVDMVEVRTGADMH